MTPKARPRKYKYTVRTVLEWTNSFSTLQVYLSHIQDKAENALRVFHYCDWANKTPDELIELKRDVNSLDAEMLLDKFVYSKVDLPDSTKSNVITAVRGFYRANYRVLQPQAGKFDYVPKKPQRYPNKQHRLILYKACYTPRDKSIVLAATCTAIALETMAKIRWNHLEPDWMHQETPCLNIEGELLKGKNRGKYKGTRQITFLTPEAKQALIEYREWFSRTFHYAWRDEDQIYLNIKDPAAAPISRDGMSQIIVELVKRTINVGVGFGIHDGRRIVQTALESVSCPNNWIKKIKGRKCTGEESPYSKPAIEQLRKKYREALPELEFLNVTETPETKTKIQKLETDVDALRCKMQDQTELRRYFDEQIKEIYRQFNQNKKETL